MHKIWIKKSGFQSSLSHEGVIYVMVKRHRKQLLITHDYPHRLLCITQIQWLIN